jgi:hypothetical protein
MSKIEKPEIEEWLAVRREEALRIDPLRAELCWSWVDILDPYGLFGATDEYCIGRVFFVRNPESKIWVESADLPEPTHEALCKRIAAGDFDSDDLPF